MFTAYPTITKCPRGRAQTQRKKLSLKLQPAASVSPADFCWMLASPNWFDELTFACSSLSPATPVTLAGCPKCPVWWCILPVCASLYLLAICLTNSFKTEHAAMVIFLQTVQNRYSQHCESTAYENKIKRGQQELRCNLRQFIVCHVHMHEINR